MSASTPTPEAGQDEQPGYLLSDQRPWRSWWWRRGRRVNAGVTESRAATGRTVGWVASVRVGRLSVKFRWSL